MPKRSALNAAPVRNPLQGPVEVDGCAGEGEHLRRLYQLLDYAGEGIVALDSACVVVYANAPAAAMLGAGASEIVGRPLYDVLRHARADGSAYTSDDDPILMTLRDGKARRSEQDHFCCGDGSSFPVELTCTPVWEDEAVTGAVVAIRDITERMRHRSQIVAGEERFRRLIETASEGIWLVDDSYRTTYANKQLADMLGYAAEEMLGRHVMEFLDEEGKQVLAAQIERRKSGHQDAYELRYKRKDGGDVWTISRANPLTDADGVFEGALCMLTDITGQRAAQLELEQSEARFRGVVENLNEGILILDFDGRIEYCNSRMASLTGYEVSELLGNTVYQLLLSPEQQGIALEQSKKRRAGVSSEYEICISRKDSSQLWVEVKASPYRDSSDEIVGTLCAVTDISRRKEDEAKILRINEELEARVADRTAELATRTEALEIANEALKMSERAVRAVEQRLRTVLANLPAIVYCLEPTGTITMFEGQGLKRLNYEAGYGVGRHISDLYSDRPDVEENLRIACERDTHSFFVQSAGLLFNNITFAFRDETGEIKEIIGLGLDVTERHRAEIELEAQRGLLRRVIDTDPNLIFVKDRDGRFTLANQAVADVFGITVEELIGKTDADFNPNADEVEHFVAMDRKVIDGMIEMPSFEEKITDASGNVRWLQTVKQPFLMSDGPCNHVLGVASDITQLKLLQSQVIQSEKLAAIGELVAGVAHEINNPLAAIAGSAQLLEMQSDEKLKQRGATIRRMADRASRIVRSLLTFARGSGESRSACSINETVQSTMEMCSYKLERSQVELELNLADPEPYALIKDSQIQQVVLNLINNAEHALRGLPQGRRKIVISTATETDADNSKQWAFIRVADSGCGIAPEVIGRIFDPFFTTKEVGEGTGLGLSLCHGIVESHEGSLTVESKPGKGAAFTIRLPMATAEARVTKRAA